jgi:hypothetical protein
MMDLMNYFYLHNLMGEDQDRMWIKILEACLEGEARSFVQRNCTGAGCSYHHWSFFLILEEIEEHFITAASEKVAQTKLDTLKHFPNISTSCSSGIRTCRCRQATTMPEHDSTLGLRSDIYNEIKKSRFHSL